MQLGRLEPESIMGAVEAWEVGEITTGRKKTNAGQAGHRQGTSNLDVLVIEEWSGRR